MKFKDTKSLGKSVIAPFQPSEDWRKRHARRKNTNLAYTDQLKEWCNTHGWDFEIKNDGHHWIFDKQLAILTKDTVGFHRVVVEWWPSSAKLVKNKQWKKGIHCHDYLKVIGYLEKQ